MDQTATSSEVSGAQLSAVAMDHATTPPEQFPPIDLLGLSPAQMNLDVSEQLRALLSTAGDTSITADTKTKITRLLAALSPVPDLQFLATIIPKPEDFNFPERHRTLARESMKRMRKSDLVFPPPAKVLDAIGVLLGNGLGPASVFSMQLHAANFMRKMNISRDGLAASRILLHLVRAADPSSNDALRESTTGQLLELGSSLGYWAPRGVLS